MAKETGFKIALQLNDRRRKLWNSIVTCCCQHIRQHGTLIHYGLSHKPDIQADAQTM